MQRVVIVGKFGRTYGTQGWLKIQSFTNPPENILQYSPWFILREGTWQTLALEDARLHGTSIIARIASSNSKEDSALFTNVEIAVQRAQFPELKDDEFYWTDLIGLTVIDTEANELGRVENLLATGSNDVLVLKHPSSPKEILVPYLNRVVKKVDLAGGKIHVDWDPDF